MLMLSLKLLLLRLKLLLSLMLVNKTPKILLELHCGVVVAPGGNRVHLSTLGGSRCP